MIYFHCELCTSISGFESALYVTPITELLSFQKLQTKQQEANIRSDISMKKCTILLGKMHLHIPVRGSEGLYGSDREYPRSSVAVLGFELAITTSLLNFRKINQLILMAGASSVLWKSLIKDVRTTVCVHSNCLLYLQLDV